MSPELEQVLYERYPRIFACRHAPPGESSMGWGCMVGDGWHALLDDLCGKLQRETDQRGAPQAVAMQVKEKFGSLRFRVREASLRQQVWIRRAEKASLRTCEVCGQSGRVIHGSECGVWTRCYLHRLF
ncbi:hypothetical protein [Rhodanobacter umsongensis]